MTITNTYEKQTGSLKLTKEVSGVADSSKYTDKTYEFIVKNSAGQYVKPDGSLSSTEETISVKGGETVTISGLDLGTYTVKEKRSGAEIDGYSLETVAGEGGAKVIAGTEPVVMTITNTYEKQTGSLKLTKVVSGVADSSKYTNKTYEFIVKNSAGQYVKQDGSLSSTEETISVKGGETVTISGLDLGTYTVKEKRSGAEIDGYSLETVAGEGGAKVIAGTEPVVMTITNTYEKQTGSLKLTKAVSGVADSSKYTDKTYEFIVKNSAGQYVKPDGSLSSTEATVSVKGGASVTISGLEPGTYTVSEKTDAGLVNIGGYDFKGVTGTGNVEVVSGTVEKTITNTYEKPTVPETTPVETTTPSGGGGGGGGEHPHPLPETTPVETTPAETTVPETTPVETTTPGGGNGGPSEEVETDEYGRVRGANRGKNKNGQDGGNVKGANRGKTRTGDESRMSIFGFGFLAAVLVLLGWFGIRFTKRNRR